MAVLEEKPEVTIQKHRGLVHGLLEQARNGFLYSMKTAAVKYALLNPGDLCTLEFRQMELPALPSFPAAQQFGMVATIPGSVSRIEQRSRFARAVGTLEKSLVLGKAECMASQVHCTKWVLAVLFLSLFLSSLSLSLSLSLFFSPLASTTDVLTRSHPQPPSPEPGNSSSKKSACSRRSTTTTW